MNALDALTAAGGHLHQFFTEAYVAQAKAYRAPLVIRAEVGRLEDLVQYAGVVLLGLHVWLYARCERFTARVAARFSPGGALERYRRAFARVWRGPGMGAALAFVAALTAFYWLLAEPETVYFRFIRERRFGLSHYTLAHFLADQGKGLLLDVLVTSASVVALYALMRHLPRRWGAVLGVVGGLALLASAALDPYRARLVYSFKPLPQGAARTAITSVLAKGHVPFQNVVVEDMSRTTEKGDAYFAGQGPTRIIVVGDTLLGRYTPEELAAIVAHEMGHLQESRWGARLRSALGLLLAMLGLQALLALCARRRWFGMNAPADVAGFAVVLLAWWAVNTLVGPASGAFSRAREAAANGYALALTQDPQSFATMMAKLTVQNRADPVPARWLVLLEAGHPEPARRIAHALAFARDHGIAINLPPPLDSVPAPTPPVAAGDKDPP